MEDSHILLISSFYKEKSRAPEIQEHRGIVTCPRSQIGSALVPCSQSSLTSKRCKGGRVCLVGSRAAHRPVMLGVGLGHQAQAGAGLGGGLASGFQGQKRGQPEAGGSFL
jgi:hypothetical protein